MRILEASKSIFLAFIMTLIVLSILGVTSAQVRSSATYQLQSDSLNVGGGLSESASYVQESTVGEIATGFSTSSTYSLRAGYQQMQEVYLSLSTTGNVVMSPDLPGLTGGTSNGSTTFTVITDSPSGYELTVEAENDPAMQSASNAIDDYNPGAEPDFSFLIGGSDAHFGYTPEGVDIDQRFRNDGGSCNAGTADASLACWDGLTTSPVRFATNGSSNHPTGATTTIHFRVGIGSSAGVESGVYTATTTVTALPL